MNKKISIIILSIILFFSLKPEAFAIYDPTTVSNNHFGMHIVDTSDLPEVAKLVNSNGGDWGYVTLVIQKGERNVARWQKVFDEMRRLHLIPIFRIATAPLGGDTWEKPSINEVDGWVSFLNSLNWVIKNRYIIVGNEPNHVKEWGGQINAKEYADYFKLFSQKLKSANADFFVIPAGFDASASNTRTTEDEALYLKQMFDEDSHVFDYIDGWASHSYPNPNFSGSGDGVGKGSVRTYVWELSYLESFGFTKKLPVFITETGWVHGTNLTTNIGSKIEKAFTDAWSEKEPGQAKRVVAVTPFVFNYKTPPFDIFSWTSNSGQYYDFYYSVLGLPKIKGEPVQIDTGEILTGFFPKISLNGEGVRGVVFAKNNGQAIWNNSELGLSDPNFVIESMFPATIEPSQVGAILIKGELPQNSGMYDLQISITNKLKNVTNSLKSQVIVISKIPTLLEVVIKYVHESVAQW